MALSMRCSSGVRCAPNAQLGPRGLAPLRPALAGLGHVLVERTAPASRPARKQTVQAQALFKKDKAQPVDPSDPQQVALRNTAGAQKNLSFIAFWLQLALTLASAGVLLFSIAFMPRVPSVGAEWSKYLTMVGVVFAFISTFFAHGFLRLSRTLLAGGVVKPTWITGNLLANNTLNLAGIGATVIGLQASVGSLVAKSLMTSAQGAYAAPPQNAVVSLDVFALQAATNTLLCHIISLLFTNLMIRIVNGAIAKAQEPALPVGTRPDTLGVNPWEFKAT